MARCCACTGPDAGRALAHLAALTGRAPAPAHAPGPAAQAALIPGEPGFATGPFSADGATAVGEVTLHNRPELLAELAAADRPAPAGCPDGELLLRLWRALGADGVRLADGLFVLTVVDGPDLVLIRDHAGARTVFYARADGCWAASTSLRAAPLARAAHRCEPGRRPVLPHLRLPARRGDPAARCPRGAAGADPATAGGRLGPAGAVLGAGRGPARGRRRRARRGVRPALRALLEQAVARRLPPGEDVAVLLSGVSTARWSPPSPPACTTARCTPTRSASATNCPTSSATPAWSPATAGPTTGS
ncbi:hypothetical protein ACFQ0M_05505 [Kitasatospora aburaviensis]